MKSPQMLLALLGFFVSFALSANDKDEKEYWHATGLSMERDIARDGTFSRKSCYDSILAYRACIAGLNALAANAEPPVMLVPSAVASDPQFEYGQAVKRFSGLSLVPVVAGQKEKNKKESVFDLYKKANQQRAAVDAAILSLFKQSVFRPVNFEEVFADVYQSIKRDPSEEAMMVGSIINAILREHDAHARIVPLAQQNEESSGADRSFGGIGVEISKVESRILVMKVTEGGPADQAGLLVNDVILGVDGVSVVGKDTSDAIKLIRGPMGQTVKLKILRDGKEILVSVVRGKIVIENVTLQLVKDLGPDLAHLRLRTFSDKKSCEKLKTKIGEIQKAGAKGLILDLRGNPGGYLDASICIGGLFVGQEVIVKVKDLPSDKMASYVSQQPKITDLEMVTLIDSGSASASEIVSGALQDHKRSWIMGERSFGKGTVQSGSVLPGEKLLWFKTIQRFYQPSGRTNQILGISPDFEVPFKPDATEEELFRLREADFYANALAATGPVWKQTRPEEVANISKCLESNGRAKSKYQEYKAKKGIEPDYQLLMAQELFLCTK